MARVPPGFPRAILVLFVACNVSAQVDSSSVVESVHRFDYHAENFSIAVPTAWSEIDPAALAPLIAAVFARLTPSLPMPKIVHGFRPQQGWTGFPWVSVILSNDHVTDADFASLDRAHRTMDQFIEKWQNDDGAVLKNAQMTDMSYDQPRHVLWAISKSTISGVDLQTLSAAYITKAGSVQVHCYSKAVDFQENRSVCRQIIESVVIDKTVAFTN